MPHPTLDMIGIAVEDMARSLAFYRELGFAIPAAMDDEHHVEITLDNGLRVGWDTHDVIRSFDDDWQPITEGHGIGLAFLCEDAAAVDATYTRLTELGYTGSKAPFDAFWGQRYAQIEDPDGYLVDLFAPLDNTDDD